MPTRQPPPWPAPSPRPAGVRAVARHRPDGTTEWHWYDRTSGARLPDPAEPGFAAALAQARRQADRPDPNGSVAAAVAAWLRSPEFKSKRPRTRDHREHYITPLRRAQDVTLERLRRATILEWRDVVAEARGPGAASAFVAVVQAFLSWCVDRGLIDSNPALRIRALERGSLTPWTTAEAQQAMKAFPEPARRAVVLAYHTGQRRGDLVALTWANVDLKAGRIRLQQQKARGPASRKEWLTIPIPPALRLELEHWKRAPLGARSPHAMTILTTARGRPWEATALSSAVHRAATEASMRPGLNLHGLRKLRAATLAEHGATAKEIAAITGHKTLAMVAYYTEGADQERLAQAAMIRLNPKKEPTT